MVEFWVYFRTEKVLLILLNWLSLLCQPTNSITISDVAVLAEPHCASP